MCIIGFASSSEQINNNNDKYSNNNMSCRIVYTIICIVEISNYYTLQHIINVEVKDYLCEKD